MIYLLRVPAYISLVDNVQMLKSLRRNVPPYSLLMLWYEHAVTDTVGVCGFAIQHTIANAWCRHDEFLHYKGPH